MWYTVTSILGSRNPSARLLRRKIKSWHVFPILDVSRERVNRASTLSTTEMVVKVRPFLFTSIATALHLHCTAYVIYIRLDGWSAYLPTLDVCWWGVKVLEVPNYQRKYLVPTWVCLWFHDIHPHLTGRLCLHFATNSSIPAKMLLWPTCLTWSIPLFWTTKVRTSRMGPCWNIERIAVRDQFRDALVELLFCISTWLLMRFLHVYKVVTKPRGPRAFARVPVTFARFKPTVQIHMLDSNVANIFTAHVTKSQLLNNITLPGQPNQSHVIAHSWKAMGVT